LNIEEKNKLNPKVKEVLEWVYCIIIALVLAMLFRYFIGTPTIVKQVSMYPTLIQDERLWLNRWGRTVKSMPEKGDIVTFEEPLKLSYNSSLDVEQSNPVAKYDEKKGINWFIYNFLEIRKKKLY